MQSALTSSHIQSGEAKQGRGYLEKGGILEDLLLCPLKSRRSNVSHTKLVLNTLSSPL